MLRTAGLVAAGTALALPAGTAAPVVGAPGVGEPVFFGLGNGGYDAVRYGIDLTYEPITRRVVGQVRMPRCSGTWTYASADPLATELVQFSVGGTRCWIAASRPAPSSATWYRPCGHRPRPPRSR